MKRVDTRLPGVAVIEVPVHGDERGFLLEGYRRDKFVELGIENSFLQDNHSRSRRGTLRGLHYQLRRPQAKLVRVARGAIFDVVVDIRLGSPDFGAWVGRKLSDTSGHMLFVPRGFAHGFCVLSEEADVIYKCDEVYVPDDQFGIAWDDPMISIEWPTAEPILSQQDTRWPKLEDAQASLPAFIGDSDVLAKEEQRAKF